VKKAFAGAKPSVPTRPRGSPGRGRPRGRPGSRGKNSPNGGSRQVPESPGVKIARGVFPVFPPVAPGKSPRLSKGVSRKAPGGGFEGTSNERETGRGFFSRIRETRFAGAKQSTLNAFPGAPGDSTGAAVTGCRGRRSPRSPGAPGEAGGRPRNRRPTWVARRIRKRIRFPGSDGDAERGPVGREGTNREARGFRVFRKRRARA
jgi:hypothetical protein